MGPHRPSRAAWLLLPGGFYAQSTPLYQIEECPDLYVDACACNVLCNLVALSARGHEAVTQQLPTKLALGLREKNSKPRNSIITQIVNIVQVIFPIQTYENPHRVYRANLKLQLSHLDDLYLSQVIKSHLSNRIAPEEITKIAKISQKNTEKIPP